MPEIQLSRVVSVSSADPLHPAENLLQPDGGGRWRGAAGEKQISVVLELAAPRRVQRLHIGNDGAAFVEVLVGTAAEGSFQVLLPSAAFMSPRESRAGEQPRRVRLFGPEALVGGGAEREWDRVRLVCSQPYCQSRPFGLSFIRLFSPPEGDDPPTAAPVRRLGPFTVREEGGSPRRPPGALFYQRPPSPTAPPQPPPGPSYAVATLQASAGPSPKPPKRRPPPPTPPKTNGTPRKRPTPPSPRGAAPTPTSGTPPPRSGTSPLPPPTPILEGVVLVLSGFQNPLRGQLRAAALSLGATYRPEWTPDSTHLVCAFPRTPKAARARGLGGLLVGPAWIWDCQRQQRRLPVGPYLLDGAASSDSEGDGPEDAPPPPRPHPTPKAPPTTTPPPSGAPADPVTSDPAGSGSDEASSDSDQWERDDPYGGSTEENSEEGEGQEDPIPPLPDFFAHQTFLFHGGFAAGEGRRLRRYVIAFGGTVAPYMNDSVTHVVTAQEWDPAFEEALELRPSLIFVRPRWLLLCGERQRPLPAQPYAVVPRP